MRIFMVMALGVILTACNRSDTKLREMQSKMDSLQKQINETYKPGFGEFMTGIQSHHAKLWFAGQAQNWSLADFEMHEIQENLDAIQKFCGDRPEVKSVGMIRPALDSVDKAIQQKNLPSFKSSFILLTNTCNNCHKATEHGFNVVTVPTGLPVVNQDFKPLK